MALIFTQKTRSLSLSFLFVPFFLPLSPHHLIRPIDSTELVKLRAQYDIENKLMSGNTLYPGDGTLASGDQQSSTSSGKLLSFNLPPTTGSSSTTSVITSYHRPRDVCISTTSSITHTSSSDLSPPSPGLPDLDDDSRNNSKDGENWSSNVTNDSRMRTMSELTIEPTATVDDLLAMFKETESLEEQGDILHYLAYNKGIHYDTGLGTSFVITVKDLLKDLYEKACQERKWALVRHTAGILGKKVEDLAKAVTDILVRQKQVTIGMPPASEHTIVRPIPSKELRQVINKAHGGDQSTAMLTQELLVFLAMFIRTEPQLFSEMLRLRVGLIIQVMASELGRALKCTGAEASEHLLNLSPYEMKMLLHHILSGKEFGVKGGSYSSNNCISFYFFFSLSSRSVFHSTRAKFCTFNLFVFSVSLFFLSYGCSVSCFHLLSFIFLHLTLLYIFTCSFSRVSRLWYKMLTLLMLMLPLNMTVLLVSSLIHRNSFSCVNF